MIWMSFKTSEFLFSLIFLFLCFSKFTVIVFVVFDFGDMVSEFFFFKWKFEDFLGHFVMILVL